jgi:hypothetical protein
LLGKSFEPFAFLLPIKSTYLFSDKCNLSRVDIKPTDDRNSRLKSDEKEILFLASLAPSGHNTQLWFVQYLEPYHWIIGNDRTFWSLIDNFLF